jgi:putative transposase
MQGQDRARGHGAFHPARIFEENDGRYGARRINCELGEIGILASRKRVAGVIASMGLQAKGTPRRYRRYGSPVSDAGESILNRGFDVPDRNKIRVGDITYIPTKEGFPCLSVFMDLFSRKIVGWSTGKPMTENLFAASLEQAVSREKPGTGLLVHTDRGSQHASKRFALKLSRRGYGHSYSHKGNPYDNAVMESFYRTLKREMPVVRKFKDRLEARQEIFKFIELCCNTKRAHSSLGYMSPVTYERANSQ